MVVLSLVHYIYFAFILLILIIMCLKKDITLPCLLGIFLIGIAESKNFISSIQILYKAIIVSSKEFIEIIIIISLISAMTNSLRDLQADKVMIKPLERFIKNKESAFFMLGFTMLITSWLIWPTPAVAFIGSIMVPAAVKAGLSPLWCAVAIDLFGNGAALSSDFFIQAGPSITAKALGLTSPYPIIKSCIPLWAVMSSITILTSYLLFKADTKIVKNPEVHSISTNVKVSSKVRFIGYFVTTMFVIDIIIMYKYKLRGSESTALIGGTSIIIMIISSIIRFKIKGALGEITSYIRNGFMFGMKAFAPIIVIGAFFFLGNKSTAALIFNQGSPSILSDLGMFISQSIPVNKTSVVIMESSISALMGVGGSGFAGLPLIGTLASVFSNNLNISGEKLAALGQIITIWVGGGTIIPWSVVPIAAVCNADPMDIVKKNIIPVIAGIFFTVILTLFII
ncbi:MAG: rane protein [Clostridiaceae bacterium]|jgi:hypothetical protein|nr:rane protein [Clostridiaceae bacterium]